MPQSPNLLPCPFCGGSNLEQHIDYIKCADCRADGPLEGTLTYWNTRPDGGDSLREALNKLIWAVEDKVDFESPTMKRCLQDARKAALKELPDA